MRGLLLAAILAGGASGAAAQSCQGTTQRDANLCAMERWEASDAELNRLWKVLKPAADGAGWGERLLSEQRSWLARRDATCDGELQGGGSAAPMFYWSCMDEMTKARNAEFRGMMN